MKERQKFEEAWGEMEEVNNSQKVNRTDQLEALGFKMKAKNHNLPKEKSNQFRKMKCRGCEKKSQKKKRETNRGVGGRKKIEIVAIGKHGTFIRIPFSEIPEGIAD